MTGLKRRIGVALISIASAELVGARIGIGYLIWNSRSTSRWTRAGGLMVAAILGFASFVALAALETRERAFVRWRASPPS
jgi:ABC-type nitrate/sulfonate/bicarbonate transport system permease component